jgi:lysophospholipid hydrolase
MVSVPAGQYLFRVGDADEFVHVVQSGRMNVHIREGDKTTTIKIVEPGETVSSLLSFIDVLTGYPSPFKTVCCKALTDSLVIKLPAAAFADVFDKNAEMLIRVVQMAMARLQRVIFVGLHQHIGLSSELIRQIASISGGNHGEFTFV